MKITVECESGYSGCDRPKRLSWKGGQQEIAEILREWREQGAKHFHLVTKSGLNLKLALYETTGAWIALEVLNSS